MKTNNNLRKITRRILLFADSQTIVETDRFIHYLINRKSHVPSWQDIDRAFYYNIGFKYGGEYLRHKDLFIGSNHITYSTARNYYFKKEMAIWGNYLGNVNAPLRNVEKFGGITEFSNKHQKYVSRIPHLTPPSSLEDDLPF